MPGPLSPPARPVAVLLAALSVIALSSCTAEDVTGEPQDIRTLIHLDAGASGCDRSADGDLTFRVVLANSGEDERRVTITPVMTDREGDARESSLESFPVTVPGHDDGSGELQMDAAPGAADLTACAVRIDGHDPEPVPMRDEDG